tara:strand:- start:3945 stop:4166 length:222 start_codon:yes stop_codon:yes gene_type:complete
MAINKKKKPTNKEIIQAMNNVYYEMERINFEIFNIKKIQDLYVKFNDDAEKFLEFIKKEMPVDDKDSKKTEDK